ncbi:SIN3-HDAC complex-associated factor isoform X2 [Harpegnathos saltator]|uniref:Protein FAM60A n=2 Tax=Harpegnathos saltator TaxID=610380 RepID=E2BPF7_HARSA|nr:SIN3-HDAC complex-associated factor isoform X2 [Harpegnathos saltator]XP_011142673.1 SIN3-HDAC complex-associated factor isoform X2 [Harpegnathos saltator]XP_011142678.1 SIN3-HDAC complex-associated factor isoform X2 [Harpegnathos saltator]XP_025160756.1 SIN3-HDAC complex-associated factor isoform X2 [Harpegnathos saltator]XP_025160757.1 SIN3-HDAC complex-associated factor isoform X2 [Harpegnathos saltator]EFN82361.1 Protein FAM60A [Harpegnathos saltator]
MFNFHKPKVYRSATGCCICKAKSSSSRFTDSKKYEDDFLECFQLQERRTGEICNACVLLVKRWKKLPAGSNRNWRHVVDARAGPGIKSLTKYKSRNKKKVKDKPEKIEKIVKKKYVYSKTEADREHSPAMSDELTEYYSIAEVGSKSSSRSESPADSDDIAEKQIDVPPVENMEVEQSYINDFIDLSYFKREIICCGTIFKGPYGEVIVDPSLLKPCVGCLATRRQRQRSDDISSASEATSPIHSASVSPAHSVELPPEASVISSKQNAKTTFSDSSSDSGYDECSNQGAYSGNKIGKHGQDIKLLQRMDQMSYKSLTVDADVAINPPSQIQPVSSN